MAISPVYRDKLVFDEQWYNLMVGLPTAVLCDSQLLFSEPGKLDEGQLQRRAQLLKLYWNVQRFTGDLIVTIIGRTQRHFSNSLHAFPERTHCIVSEALPCAH